MLEVEHLSRLVGPAVQSGDHSALASAIGFDTSGPTMAGAPCGRVARVVAREHGIEDAHGGEWDAKAMVTPSTSDVQRGLSR